MKETEKKEMKETRRKARSNDGVCAGAFIAFHPLCPIKSPHTHITKAQSGVVAWGLVDGGGGQ